jgi:hypothetical protein
MRNNYCIDLSDILALGRKPSFGLDTAQARIKNKAGAFCFDIDAVPVAA